MSGQVVPVGLLTSYIRQLFESDELLADVWVEGEVSDVFAARSGHVYFTMRDAGSQIRCVTFRHHARRQTRAPQPGEQIAAHGRVSVYERDGVYQLYADSVQPAGLGILALQRALLRQKLSAEGLFDPARKRPIPAAPRHVGVVTSPDGAVWHDIQTVFRRRYPLAHLILAPSSVQGDSAPEMIVAALHRLQEDGRAEVIIVARGGGSAEDLWCFNDERVVRAVFACRVPVVSAVGHETDWTLIDEVADLRAPTPSAAAELCSPSIVDLSARIVDLQRQANQGIADALDRHRAACEQLSAALRQRSPARGLSEARTRLDSLVGALRQLRDRTIVAARWEVEGLRSAAQAATGRYLREQGEQVRLHSAVLDALAPRRVLGRGYALLTAGDEGPPVYSVADVAVPEALAARLLDGVIWARVQGRAYQPLPSPGAIDVAQ